jgi:predicted GTPase
MSKHSTEGSVTEGSVSVDEVEPLVLDVPPVAELVEEAVVEPVEEPSAPSGSELAERLEALGRLVSLGTGRLDDDLMSEAGDLLARSDDRLALSAEHTVITLAGGTGSGKSSLFNAICGLELSPTGLRRPMTSAAHACVWGLDGAGPLLDWLAVDKRFRYARASALDRAGAGGESLRGLVLIDLPDHDSIQDLHRAEVDRFVKVADLLIWVVDPQKYADAALHRDYIVPFARHAAVTVIVLNQVDRLQPNEVDDCVTDLRRLLEAEGLNKPHIITTSAITEGGADGLRRLLSETVAGRVASAERLGADLDNVMERLAALAGDEPPAVRVDEVRAEALIDALTVAAGVPAVAEAMESAYELRAADYVGWPISRWVRSLRRDPLRMMRLTELRDELRGAFTGPVGAQQGDVDNALQGITDVVAVGTPTPWRRSIRDSARTHAADLPDALGASLKETLPTFNQVPRWWWFVKGWQYLLVAGAITGTIWVGLLVTFGLFEIGDSSNGLINDASLLPYVLVLVACMFGMGALTSAACRNVVALSAAKHGERIELRMRESIGAVATKKVLLPIANELSAYAEFREMVASARRLSLLR